MKKRSYTFKGIEYKSKGELKIAKFLTKNRIKFEYEQELRLTRTYDNEKSTLIYPDFYIPNNKLIIEYFGMDGDLNYDKETKYKKEIYKHNDYDLISVFSDTPDFDWEREILEKVNKFSFTKLFNLVIFSPKIDFNFKYKKLIFPLKLLFSFLVILFLFSYLFNINLDNYEDFSFNNTFKYGEQEKNYYVLNHPLKGEIKIPTEGKILLNSGVYEYGYGEIRCGMSLKEVRIIYKFPREFIENKIWILRYSIQSQDIFLDFKKDEGNEYMVFQARNGDNIINCD